MEPDSIDRVRFLPVGATADARRLLTTRGLRAVADGLVSTVLAPYLLVLGFTGAQVGQVTTATLLGSAAMTLGVGLRGHRFSRRHLLLAVSLLMIATGLVFSVASSFPLIVMAAFLGTMNPSSGDVSVFLPTEQALLSATVPDRERTAVFARFSLVAFVFGAVGSIAAGYPDRLVRANVTSRETALRSVFVVYALLGVCALTVYRRVSSSVEPNREPGAQRSALHESRAIVLRLAAVFSVDSLGGGFAVQSIVGLWLTLRYDFSVSRIGLLFFVTGVCNGLSTLLAPRIAARIGLVRTMAYTHLPANVLLMAAAAMPSAGPAVVCLIGRSLLSQMDVPARQSYVMAVVTPAERPAAASVTNVPRSLASALPPIAGGWLLDHSTFGWPLLIGGALKATYDVILLLLFRNVHPPEERSE